MCQVDWCLVFWINILDVSVKIFLDEISIWITGVSKGYCSHQGHHTIDWRPECNKKAEEKEFALSQVVLMVKNPPVNAGSVSKPGRFSGGEHGNSFQYSCLENPMDRGAWRAIVHRVTKSQHDWSNLAFRMHTPWLLELQHQPLWLSDWDLHHWQSWFTALQTWIVICIISSPGSQDPGFGLKLYHQLSSVSTLQITDLFSLYNHMN